MEPIGLKWFVLSGYTDWRSKLGEIYRKLSEINRVVLAKLICLPVGRDMSLKRLSKNDKIENNKNFWGLTTDQWSVFYSVVNLTMFFGNICIVVFSILIQFFHCIFIFLSLLETWNYTHTNNHFRSDNGKMLVNVVQLSYIMSGINHPFLETWIGDISCWWSCMIVLKVFIKMTEPKTHQSVRSRLYTCSCAIISIQMSNYLIHIVKLQCVPCKGGHYVCEWQKCLPLKATLMGASFTWPTVQGKVFRSTELALP